MTTYYNLFLYSTHPETIDDDVAYYTKVSDIRHTSGMKMLEKLVDVTADDDILRIALAITRSNVLPAYRPKHRWTAAMAYVMGYKPLLVNHSVYLTDKETEDISSQDRSRLRFICKATARELCANKAYCAAHNMHHEDGQVDNDRLATLKQCIVDYKALLALA